MGGGGWEGVGAQEERWGERRMEAEEESSLKRLVKIMKTNGDRVS